MPLIALKLMYNFKDKSTGIIGSGDAETIEGPVFRALFRYRLKIAGF